MSQYNAAWADEEIIKIVVDRGSNNECRRFAEIHLLPREQDFMTRVRLDAYAHKLALRREKKKQQQNQK